MQEHRLAAIMFSDIVGYTALMGRDEDNAFQVLRINREIHDTLIKRYNGTLIKEMGDGILASFTSASNAVRCALEIQEEAKEENISLRIGIHEGEMVYEGADVLGDGVNVASRLQALAEAGSIVISESVYREVKNKDGIFPVFIGEKILKNVDEPMKVYGVSGEEKTLKNDAGTVKGHEEKQNKKLLYLIIGGVIILVTASVLIWKYWAGPPTFQRAGTSAGKEKSIAVLPFWNNSEEKGTEYFANGVMDAILNNLCKISQLRVLSRTSSEKYRDSKLSAREIAKELEVNYLLEGSVQKYENKVRITVQLIEADKDKHILSETFDRNYTNLLNLQSEIAQEIAGRLNATLSPKEKELVEKPATTNMAAYELFLRAREYAFLYYNSSDEEHVDDALILYNKALEIDPKFALAYLGMGEIYLYRYSSTEKYLKEGFADSVMHLCDRALELDPDLAEAYCLKGLSYIYINNPGKALNELIKAISLNPNLSEANYGLGISYLFANDQVNSIINFKKAEKLDKGGKYTPDILNYIGIIYLSIYDTIHAEQYYLNSIKYQKNNYLAYQQLWELSFFLKNNLKNALSYVDTICMLFPERCFAIRGAYYMYSKNFTKAEYWYEKEREIGRKNKTILTNRSQRHGYVFWNLGRKKEAKQYFDELIAYSKNPNVLYPTADYDLAGVYAVLGEKDKAMEHFRKFINSGYFGLWGTSTLILADPMFDNLRENEEFRSLVKNGQEQLYVKREQIRKMEEKGLL